MDIPGRLDGHSKVGWIMVNRSDQTKYTNSAKLVVTYPARKTMKESG